LVGLKLGKFETTHAVSLSDIKERIIFLKSLRWNELNRIVMK